MERLTTYLTWLYSIIPQYLWVILHLFLPVRYRSTYRARIILPDGNRETGHYNAYLDIGNKWSKTVGSLQRRWEGFRNISVILLGIVIPYISTIKPPVHSLTFIFGTICHFHLSTATIFAYMYAKNANRLQDPVIVDYWLEASGANGKSGLGFWSFISLPEVWFFTSLWFFTSFVIVTLWEAVTQVQVPDLQVSGCHAILLLLMTGWAGIHLLVIYHTVWSRIKIRI